MKQLFHTLRALPTLLRVGFADAVAYRAEFLVWVLAYTMPIIMMALWTQVAREGPVGRWSERDFRAYFLCTLIVRMVTGAWVVWEMNMEVRQGTLQNRLLRPIHPLLTYLTENVAALPMRFVIALPIGLFALSWLGGSVVTSDGVQLALIPLSVFGAFLLNFLAMASIGTLALYWESSTAVFDLWLGLYTVFSGYVMPLELFPPWLRVWVDRLPFRAMLAYPVENMLGLVSRDAALRELGLQWAWVAVFVLLTNVLWRGGMKRFGAFGG
ncbi:MAG TPA: ABC-2 family transporter protein [Polyangiales bacterium]